MAEPMNELEKLRAEVEALKARKIDVDDLPVRALRQKIMFTQEPLDSPEVLMPRSVTRDLLRRDIVAQLDAASPSPVGAIMLFGGTVAPTGWLLCQGQSISSSLYPVLHALLAAAGYPYGGSGSSANLPDLQGRIPTGLDVSQTEFDALGETGGAKAVTLTTAELPSHTHDEGSLAVSSVGDHTHGAGTLTTNSTGSHTHGTGTLTTDSTGSHTHGAGTFVADTNGIHTHGPGTLKIDSVAGHTHSTGTLATAPDGDHSHTTSVPTSLSKTFAQRRTGTPSASTLTQVNLDTPFPTLTSSTDGSHSHTISGATASDGAHTHTVSGALDGDGAHGHNILGTSASDGAHSHTLSGATGNNGAHSHTLSGATGSDGAHSHTLSGATGGAGSGGAHSNLQPYVVVNYIIKV